MPALRTKQASGIVIVDDMRTGASQAQLLRGPPAPAISTEVRTFDAATQSAIWRTRGRH